jgi:DNA-binding NarL/FixJ family response regulator
MIVEHPLSIIRLYREKWIREKFSIERETLARLHFDEGLTNKELAERFNVSTTTIKVMVLTHKMGRFRLSSCYRDSL